MIAKHYMKGWFTLDVLASIPWDSAAPPYASVQRATPRFASSRRTSEFERDLSVSRSASPRLVSRSEGVGLSPAYG